MKNFTAILRRYKVAMLMNFIGLVLAFSAFMVLMAQVEHQNGFDKGYPTSGRIYRIDKKDIGKEDTFRNILPRGYADDIISSSPHIAAGSISCPYIGEVVFYKESSEGRFPFRHECDVVYPEFFDIFGTEFIEGSADALNDLQKVAIPHSLAEKLYGDESAIGKILSHNEKYKFGDFRNPQLTIGAVYEDFPANSQFGNKIYMHIGSIHEGSYGGANFICWLLLDSADNKEAVEQNFNDNYDYGEGTWLTDIELTPVEEIYFSEGEHRVYKTGSRSKMWLMVCVSILVMLIGGLNYATFFTALAPLRVKSINTQKVFGSSLARLRASLMGEAVAFSLLAFVFSMCIANPVSDALVKEGLVESEFGFGTNLKVILLSAVIAVVTGIVSGLYPSLYVTSLPPAFALKGNFAFSASGRRFRTAMIVFQYIVSFTLMTFALLAYRQNRFMLAFKSGFDKDRLAVVELSQNHALDRQDWLKDRLTSLAEVEDVAFAMELIGGSDSYSTATVNKEDQQIRFYTIYCSDNLLKVLGIPVTDGRDFIESDAYAGRSIANSRFKELVGGLGSYPETGEIIGCTAPVRINSLRDEEAPTCYVLFPKEYGSLNYTYIRLHEGFNKDETVKKISSVLKEMDSEYIFDIRFYDEITEELYGSELRQGRIISVFSLLAAMLSLIGIFGQVMLDAQYRRRDIAVRKVYGAERREILMEGLGKYILLVVVTFAVAAPLAWFAADKWMEGFVERVPAGIWPYAASFVALLCLTLLIVAYQYSHTSSVNPAETLKSE